MSTADDVIAALLDRCERAEAELARRDTIPTSRCWKNNAQINDDPHPPHRWYYHGPSAGNCGARECPGVPDDGAES